MDRLDEIANSVKQSLVNDLERMDLIRMEDDELKQKIAEYVAQTVNGLGISIRHRVEIEGRVFSSFRGLGALDSILRDETITEIMINGYDNIFVERAGKLSRLNQTFESEEQLLSIINQIVEGAGREVSTANPIVDTRLKNGSRVNVILRPISLKGPIVTIRKFSKIPMTMDTLVNIHHSIPQEVADKLRLLVNARYNIFISGGTGSGKTTFLNALSNYIPKDERIITIEDSAELQITGVDNLVSLETRNANTAGTGAISIRNLIKASLRMRPDRIVVGEVRGEEALDMLQAMNTGHDGSLSTGHANSARDMLSRLEIMVLTGADNLSLDAVRQQIASALDIIIHLSRLRDYSRKTIEITEVLGVKNGEYILNPIYRFEEDENTRPDKVSGRLVRTKNPFKNTEKLLRAGCTQII